MSGFLRSVLFAIVAAASVVPALAGADTRADGSFVLARRDRGPGAFDMAERILPLEVVLGSVARSIPGRHLDVDGPFQRGGRWIYRIKWLTPDGRVLIVFADAETGQILDTRGER